MQFTAFICHSVCIATCQIFAFRELAEKQRLLKELEETKRKNEAFKASEAERKKKEDIKNDPAYMEAEKVLKMAEDAADKLQHFLPSQVISATHNSHFKQLETSVK